MFKSLRWRIQSWYAILLGLVIFSFASIIYWQQRRVQFQSIDDELDAAAEVLLTRIDGLPDVSTANILTRQERAGDFSVPGTFSPRHIRHDREAPFFIIWEADGSLLATSNSGLTVPLPITFGRLEDTNRRRRFRQRGSFREVCVQSPSGVGLVVGRLVTPDLNDLGDLLALLLGVGTVVFAIGLAGGWWFAAQAIRPIHEMDAVASGISATNLSQRIDVTETDTELGGLANTLNAAFDRLEQAFEQQVQFTGDASHELRTPLSVILMHQDLALSKDRTVEEYREAIEVNRRAARRMKSLIDSLLTLARMDADGFVLSKEHFPVVEAIDVAVEVVQPLAETKEIELVRDVDPSLTIHADRDRIVQVLTNLLTNAVQYSPPQSRVEVHGVADGRETKITVTDQGDGIKAANQERVFQRFFRVDADRSRDAGGSGLGLAICKAIVDAHEGHIGVASGPGAGSRFTFSLPSS